MENKNSLEIFNEKLNDIISNIKRINIHKETITNSIRVINKDVNTFKQSEHITSKIAISSSDNKFGSNKNLTFHYVKKSESEVEDEIRLFISLSDNEKFHFLFKKIDKISEMVKNNYKRNYSKKTCHNCNNVGHISKFCKEYRNRCYNCKRFGHLNYFCRLNDYNEKRFNKIKSKMHYLDCKEKRKYNSLYYNAIF